jgi:hypothetical protein
MVAFLGFSGAFIGFFMLKSTGKMGKYASEIGHGLYCNIPQIDRRLQNDIS